MNTALPLPPRSPWPGLDEAFACTQQDTTAPVSESRVVERATVRCQPRALWTVPPSSDERVEWMRAMARGEDSIQTVMPAAK